jgi:hypothetical protein
MKPEKQQLIHDLLGDNDRRAVTLLAGGRILRRRRHWRVAVRGMAMITVLAGVAVWYEGTHTRKPTVLAPTEMAVSPSPASPQPPSLTDDQLLALFPNTPLGLATLADGRKRLIFPRPGDEQKFITHL